MNSQNFSPETATDFSSPLAERQWANNTLCDSLVNTTIPRLDVVESVVKAGFVGIHDQLPSQQWFDALYALYDQLIDRRIDDAGLSSLSDECAAWGELPGNRNAFAGAPVGFRDRRQTAGKEQKTYFQYNREFGHYLKSSKGGSFYRDPLFRIFCERLDSIAVIAQRVFHAALHELTEPHDGLAHALWGFYGGASVHVKVLRYEPDAKWATTPHFDKSALTFVLNADDLDQGESFRIAPYKPGITAEELQAPSRATDDISSPSIGLLFPGMCLRAMGVNIQPSPHGVVPLQTDRKRHSMIAFLMAPGIDTNEMITDRFDQ